MATSQLSLHFLSRSNGSVAHAVAAASPRILSATPKSVRGSPVPTPRSFAGVATPKTPARSPFSAANGGVSPFFAAGSPVWSDFEMAARASAEASAQMARLALPSASAARQHCLARLARRGSKTFDSNEDGDKFTAMKKSSEGNLFEPNNNNNSNNIALGEGHNHPRLGLGDRRGGVARTSSTSGEFGVQLPVMLGNTRQEPTKVLRTRYTEEQVPGIQDAAQAAALVRENFLRRRAMIAERKSFMEMP